ncbi:MAG TPA: hypothetical protein VF484_00080, partial [Candidatus Limnocylindrales bacterium]
AVRAMVRLGSTRRRRSAAERSDLGVAVRLEPRFDGPGDRLPQEALDAALAERSLVHVSRYAVETVESALMLGFFFPGAQLTKPAVEAPVA